MDISLAFQNYYTVTGIDNITMDYPGANSVAYEYIRLNNCTGATIATTWTGINFADGFSTGHNLKAASATCAGISPIAISGSGSGYGATYENDPYNVINWN